MNTFINCQRKYYHQKVANTPKDAVDEEDTEALDIGSAFHKCLEECRHDLTSYSLMRVDDVVRTFSSLNSNIHTPLLYAMLRKYKVMHDKSKLIPVAVELNINTDTFYGFVDVVLKEPDSDKWWIADMKTASSYSPTLIPTLFNFPQLNLYASNLREVASSTGLRPMDFAGCRYRLATKSKLKRGDTETDAAYIARLEKSVKAFDFILPIERLNPAGVAAVHLKAFEEIQAKEGRIWEFNKNFSNCMAWHRPCEYWSQCHSARFADMMTIDVISGERE